MGNTDEVLDMEVVEELLALTGDGDPELLLDLIHMFLEDAPSKLEAIAQGLEAGDMERVAHAAHSLKGSAGNLGIHMVQDDCDKLQVAGRQQQVDVVRELVPQLERDFSLALAALEDLRSQYR